MATERLDKIIALQCNMTRKEARQVIRRGEVSLAGQAVTDPGTAVEERAALTFRGQALSVKEHIYLIMNKPKGVICATEDTRAKTVLDLVPEPLKRKGLFPVGRLDKDTTGLLLLTDDGAFAHELLSPRREIYKTYFALLDGEVTEETARRFREGVTLADGTVCRPAFLKPLGPGAAEIKICEGKYHQIKRMFGTEGLGVNELKRLALGEFYLPDGLKEGECREFDKTVLVPLFFGKMAVSVHID